MQTINRKAILLVLGWVTCVTLMAQSPAIGSAPSGKPPERLPGLDRSMIDTTVDPCVDFAQYSCGNFSRHYPIPNDRSSYGTSAMVADYREYVLHRMLEQAAAGGEKRTPNEQKIGDYYYSCMDAEAISQKGLAPLQFELDRIAAVKSVQDLPELLAHFQLIGINAFFGFGEQQDFNDATKQIAVLDQGGLGLPERDYYFRAGEAAERLRKEYVSHIAKTLELIGEPESDAASSAGKIMQLETALAAISMGMTARRDPKNVYHLAPIAELSAHTPNFAWDRFLIGTGTPPIISLNLANPDFFKKLGPILASTGIETIRSYLRWQLISSLPGYVLPGALDEESFDFNGRKMRGQKEQRARFKRCVQATDTALGDALGQVYVTQEFPPASKQATVQMVQDIEKAMDQDIDTLDWMSDATKLRAREKLHSVVDKIGYPDRWRDYSRLMITRGDAFGNLMRATEFESRRQIAKIGKPVDRSVWDFSPATLNAFYNPSMNDINFPAGILQPPLYDSNATEAENYSHIGAIVGHELTHGFDDQGRQFDSHGNLADWWTEADATKFKEKAACEVREYDGFVAVDDFKVNGKLTLGENTADNGGLRLAYAAFLEDAKRKAIDLAQKQDGYTPIQQFFLGYGQAWCGSTRPEQVRLQVQTDPHSPREFRVNGVVENMPEFGRAFACHAGQPMMPANGCRVW